MPRTIEESHLQATYTLEGTHTYDPPTGEVLLNDWRSEAYERQYGFYSQVVRQGYIDSSVRLGGAGGGGLTLGVMLAKEGVCDFSVADPEKIELSNIGRIPMLTPDDIGRYKADVFADLVVQHNPMARVRVYRDGIQPHNVDEFLGHDAGNNGVTVGFDEIEITEPLIALRFHRAARKFGRYVIGATDVDRGGIVTTFDPYNPKYTYEHYTGAKATDSEATYLRKVRGFQLPIIPNIPANGSISSLLAVQKKAPLPTTLRSVLHASGLAMDEFEKLLTLDDRRYGSPHIYPRIHAINPSRNEDFVTRYPRLRSSLRIAQLVVRDIAKRNPPASYSDKDRSARAAFREQVRRAAEMFAD